MDSEKRREVAANLRRIDDGAKALIEERMNRLGNDSLAKLVVISLGLCVALDGAGVHPEAVGDFWGLLADLIDPATDLGKANNYAHRLVAGEWRNHD